LSEKIAPPETRHGVPDKPKPSPNRPDRWARLQIKALEQRVAELEELVNYLLEELNL
jgi:hypothetical protein